MGGLFQELKRMSEKKIKDIHLLLTTGQDDLLTKIAKYFRISKLTTGRILLNSKMLEMTYKGLQYYQLSEEFIELNGKNP